jgi:Raf kinase inhibitor-like YbhB/YbcL family protein
MRATPVFFVCVALLVSGCGRHGFTVSTDSASNGRFHQPQFASTEGCTGANISPHLSWSGAPKDTQSFAVTMFDPDAKTDHGGFWHWVSVNLPASVDDLPENASDNPARMPPSATQMRNDYGYGGYGGPCPPRGEDHRYVITVYALKTPALLIPDTASPQAAVNEIRRQAIAHAQVTVRAGG